MFLSQPLKQCMGYNLLKYTERKEERGRKVGRKRGEEEEEGKEGGEGERKGLLNLFIPCYLT